MDAVINLKHEPKLRERFEHVQVVNNTVLVDRRTGWGNPWRVGHDGPREEVIARYRADLWRRIRVGEIALEELAELDGCWLACWCDPEPCHTAMCSPARQPGRRRCWRSGPMRDASPCFLSDAVQAEPPMGSVRVAREMLAAVLSHCPTRARSSNPEGSSGRCAPCGLAKEALGRAVKVGDREDRRAIFRTKIADFPHQPAQELLRPGASPARA